MTSRNVLQSNNVKPSRFFYGYIILIASFFILVIVGGTISSFGVFLKPVLNEFGWSRAAISSTYSLSMILGGFVGILGGRVSDRFSPRLALTVGGIFMGLGYLLMTQVHSIWQIYLFFGVLVSIGTGFIPIPLLSMVARWFYKGRGLASGIIMSGVGVGMTVIPPLANLFISKYNWRISYLVLGLASLVFIIMSAQFLRRAPRHNLTTHELKATIVNCPDLPIRSRSLREAVGTSTFWIIITMGFCFFFTAQTVIVHVAAFATDIGFSSTAAAAILSVIGFVTIGGTLGGGILGDRIGNRNALIIIFTLALLSLLGFRFSGELWMLYLCAAVFGLGYGGFSAIQSPLVADFFGLRELGVIFSFLILAQNVGGAAGSLAGGTIFDISGSYQWAFLICAILGLASLVLSMLLKPARRKTN